MPDIPDGVVVERLLEAGLAMLPVRPNLLKAAHPRFGAAGEKSDSFDAFCLAELTRTDHHLVRVLTRAHEDLVRKPGSC